MTKEEEKTCGPGKERIRVRRSACSDLVHLLSSVKRAVHTKRFTLDMQEKKGQVLKWLNSPQAEGCLLREKSLYRLTGPTQRARLLLKIEEHPQRTYWYWERALTG